MTYSDLKIAVVHDWLPLIGGAERVLEQIMTAFPHADVYTLFNFLTEDELKSLNIKTVKASYLNKLPGVKKYYRKLLSWYPQAVEDFDLSGYDLIISSSSAAAKGVIVGAHQTHVSYVHSPARYAWDLTHDYLRQTGLNKGPLGFIAKNMLHKFRIWDYRTGNGVDRFIANSHFIARRTWRTYRREADVIHPPVNLEGFTLKTEKEDFYLTASRMVPYKRMDLIVEAFAKMPDKKLVVIGDGPEMAKIRDIAESCQNIELLGFQAFATLKDHMQRAKAFIFAAEEDFGIIPVEAQACGTPVIAYGAGGALETVISAEHDKVRGTGLFFKEQNAYSLTQAVERFESIASAIKPEICRKNAEGFSPEKFRSLLTQIVDEALAANNQKQQQELKRTG